MNVTWDDICQTAKDRKNGEYGPSNVLVTGWTKVVVWCAKN